MKSNAKIYIAGHNGMVGSAIWRTLSNKGFTNLIGDPTKSKTKLGWKPQYDLARLVKEMWKSDLENLIG